jgi:hypothetical protein
MIFSAVADAVKWIAVEMVSQELRLLQEKVEELSRLVKE